jgi:hypothetical protein
MDRTPTHPFSDSPSSRKFLSPLEKAHGLPERARGISQIFAEGPWQAIRVGLERQGWTHSQIELIHDQLRQGWPLPAAKRSVATMTGHCPLRARRDG